MLPPLAAEGQEGMNLYTIDERGYQVLMPQEEKSVPVEAELMAMQVAALERIAAALEKLASVVSTAGDDPVIRTRQYD